MATMKSAAPANLRHAFGMLERDGHEIHIKNKIVDADGRTRYYVTLLKKIGNQRFNVNAANNTLSRVYGVTVRVGKGHPVASVLGDTLVQSKTVPSTYHCQRMTVIVNPQ